MKRHGKPTLPTDNPEVKDDYGFDPANPHDLESLESIVKRMKALGRYGWNPNVVVRLGQRAELCLSEQLKRRKL
jgi:hypothetical protein